MKQKPTSFQNQLLTYQAPRWKDFPIVDLYMDQVLALLNTWLVPLYPETDAQPVTASMINNYVKHSIVKPPVKKHYKPYHLGFLYVVFVLKQCFSLQEISAMIQIYSDLDNKERMSHDFDAFARIFESCLHEMMETGKIESTFFENPTWQQQLMLSALQTAASKLVTSFVIADAIAEANRKKD